MHLPICRAALLLIVMFLMTGGAMAADPELIRLPPGFRSERLASVPSARGMARSPGGTLLVGTRAGAVHALTGDGCGSLRLHRIAEGLARPVGVAFCQWLDG